MWENNKNQIHLVHKSVKIIALNRPIKDQLIMNKSKLIKYKTYEIRKSKNNQK